ncbi:MAG: hypothetical protein EB034_23660, partial [Verrucomicrobia bacterium]|nr:hypothetical protein [Verrucomicrobiota bacterium]
MSDTSHLSRRDTLKSTAALGALALTGA